MQAQCKMSPAVEKPNGVSVFKFLDDTSRTLRQFSGQKSQLERGPNFPRGAPGMLELRNVF